MRYSFLFLAVLLSARASAHCDFICSGNTEFEQTSFSGVLMFLSTLASLGATFEPSKSSSNNDLTFSAHEIESARYYLASQGKIEDSYFFAATEKYKNTYPNNQLSNLSIAALISGSG